VPVNAAGAGVAAAGAGALVAAPPPEETPGGATACGAHAIDGVEPFGGGRGLQALGGHEHGDVGHALAARSRPIACRGLLRRRVEDVGDDARSRGAPESDERRPILGARVRVVHGDGASRAQGVGHEHELAAARILSVADHVFADLDVALGQARAIEARLARAGQADEDGDFAHVASPRDLTSGPRAV